MKRLRDVTRGLVHYVRIENDDAVTPCDARYMSISCARPYYHLTNKVVTCLRCVARSKC